MSRGKQEKRIVSIHQGLGRIPTFLLDQRGLADDGLSSYQPAVGGPSVDPARRRRLLSVLRRVEEEKEEFGLLAAAISGN